MKDRAESGRGRPWNQNSLINAERLENNMAGGRVIADDHHSEIMWTCPMTHETIYVDYPTRLTYAQVLKELTRKDVAHNHHPWETEYL